MPWGLSGERTEWHLMSVYNLKTKKLSGLLNNVRGDANTMNAVYGAPVVQRKGGETLLYIHGMYVTDRTESALFRVNLTTSIETLSSKAMMSPKSGWSMIPEKLSPNRTTWKGTAAGRSGCSVTATHSKPFAALRRSIRRKYLD